MQFENCARSTVNQHTPVIGIANAYGWFTYAVYGGTVNSIPIQKYNIETFIAILWKLYTASVHGIKWFKNTHTNENVYARISNGQWQCAHLRKYKCDSTKWLYCNDNAAEEYGGDWEKAEEEENRNKNDGNPLLALLNWVAAREHYVWYSNWPIRSAFSRSHVPFCACHFHTLRIIYAFCWYSLCIRRQCAAVNAPNEWSIHHLRSSRTDNSTDFVKWLLCSLPTSCKYETEKNCTHSAELYRLKCVWLYRLQAVPASIIHLMVHYSNMFICSSVFGE